MFVSFNVTDLCPSVVLVFLCHSTGDADAAVGAFAVAPDPGDRAGCADSAAALWVAVTAAAAADGVRRRGRGRCTAVGSNLQAGDIQEGTTLRLEPHLEQYADPVTLEWKIFHPGHKKNISEPSLNKGSRFFGLGCNVLKDWNPQSSPWQAVQPLRSLLLLEQNWPADNVPGPTPAVTATAVSGREEASRPPQPQFLHLLQQTGALLPGRFIWGAAFGLQNRGGWPSTTSARGRGSTERGVQGRRLVRGGAAGGAPAGLLVVCGAGSSSCGGGGAGSSFSVTLAPAVVAFALCAAGAVDGADVMAVAHIAQRHIVGSGGAVGQAKEVRCGVEATPSSCLPVVGPVGAGGTEVFFIMVVSLEEEERFRRADKNSHKIWIWHKYSNRTRTDTNICTGGTCRHEQQSANRIHAFKQTRKPEIHANTKLFSIIYTSMSIIIHSYKQNHTNITHCSKAILGI